MITNQVFPAMFNIKTSIHMVRIISVGIGMKTLRDQALSFWLPILRLRLENSQSLDTDPHCMLGGCVQYLRSGNMDLPCMYCSHVPPPTSIFHGSTLYFQQPWHGHHHGSAMYWPSSMIELGKLVTGPMSVMSSSIIAYILD